MAEIDALSIRASEEGYRSLENGARPVKVRHVAEVLADEAEATPPIGEGR